MAKITIEIDTNSQDDLELIELLDRLVDVIVFLPQAEKRRDEDGE
tara:strand:+ start:6288 stop:6422 length:135 start_codon:yes stop_codon:yes gene_type:complete